MTQATTIEMVNGDDEHRTFYLRYRDSNDVLQDLLFPAGSSAIFSVKETKTDATPIIQKKSVEAGGSDDDVLLTSPGKIEVWLVPSDTQTLEEGNYYYDLETTISDKKKTPVIGVFRIIQGVT